MHFICSLAFTYVPHVLHYWCRLSFCERRQTASQYEALLKSQVLTFTLWFSQENCVKWDLASLETDLVGRPRLQEEKNVCLIQTPTNILDYFIFCKPQDEQIAASALASCQQFDGSNKLNADKNVDYKHDRMRHSWQTTCSLCLK